MAGIDDSEFDLWDEEDEVVRAAVEQALAPWKATLTPASIQEMRAALADVLVMHPLSATLIAGLKERAPGVVSGEEPVETSGRHAAEIVAARLLRKTAARGRR